MKYYFSVFVLIFFSCASFAQKSISLDGGKWNWDGRYLKSKNSSTICEWDGRYLKSNTSSITWEWDGRYLKSNFKKTNQYEWDGRYLINSKTKNKTEMDKNIPIPIGAFIKGLLN